MRKAKYIIGIDPGPKESGYVEYDYEYNILRTAGVKENKVIEFELSLPLTITGRPIMAIEMIASYGMAVGESTFRTCVQIGRFEKCCDRAVGPFPFDEVYRRDVKLTLCGNSRAKDTHLKQCIVDMYGGKEKAIGGNKCKTCKGKGWSGTGRPRCTSCNGAGWLNPPGPLASVKSHAWAALAVALTYAIKRGYINPSAVNPGGLCKSSQS